MTQLLLISFILTASQNPSNSQIINQDISIVRSDENGISLQYSITQDDIKPEKIIIDNTEYTVFNITNAARTNEPGMLDIPSKDIVIGIPQQGEIVVSAQVNFQTYFNNIKIAPVPYQIFEGGNSYYLRQDFKSNLYPEQICEIKSINNFRDIRIARIKLYPLQYNQLMQQAVMATDISVSVRFSEPGQINQRSDYFDGVFKDIMLNGEQATSWKSDRFENLNLNTGYSQYPQGFINWYKVKIESTGVYKITYNELKQAGIPVNIIDPRTIRLFNIGEYTPNVFYPDTMIEIPLYVAGEQDSAFDKKDYLLFYGLSPARHNKNRSIFYNNPYSKYNYYWLTWGFSRSVSGLGKRIQTVSSSWQGTRRYSAEHYVHLEKDRDCPARNGLLWIWDLFAKENGLLSKSFDLSIDLPNADSLYAISGRFYGQTSNNWLKVFLNNTMLDSFYFVGWSTSPPPFNFLVNRIMPLSANNTVSFQLFNQAGQEVFLDFLDCRYLKKLEYAQDQDGLNFYSESGNYDFVIRNALNKPLVFDITDYYQPVMITDYYKNRDTVIFGRAAIDTTYYFVTDETKARRILSIEQKFPGQTSSYADADYYIVTPDDLFQSAQLLENYHQNNIHGISSARVRTVPMSRLYDDFTFGIEEPGAIKQLFKKYQPYYGLLLGDGTYDYRNILGLTNFPTVPAYENGYDIDFQVYSTGAIAFDAWYADFEGNGASPDMALGRVTARTSNEVRQFYDKLVNYESCQTTGVWNKRFLFLSDDEWKGQGEPDEFGFEHISNNENLENALLSATNHKFRHYEPVKVYLTEYPFSETRDKRKAREALLAELSKGVALWCYFGHGAGFQLAHEQALNITHVPLVNTNHANFISFYGSCGVGRFEDTKYESVAEELVRKYDAGIATVAASKATYSGVNYAFASLFFNYLINNPDSTIGHSFLRAWYVDSSYHLFGDPAVVPALPNNFLSITSVPDTFNAGQFMQISADALGRERYAAAAYSTKWRRQYISQLGTIYYNLSGYELFRGIGNTQNDSLIFNFMIPTGLPRQVRYDILNGGGNYTEVPNTGRISAVAYTPGQENICSYVIDSIVFDTLEISNFDNTGPQIKFFNGDKRIKNQDKLPRQFNLTGIFTDSSGILLAPLVGFNPRLITKKQPNHIIEDADVSTYFNYEIGNYYQGQINYPVNLDTGRCLITFKIADNLRNLSTDSVEVVVERSQTLILDNVLYYSPPNSRNGYFTFEISKPAMVDIKIYTIAGRLVKTISNQMCNFGYNQIQWDGLDQYGQLPANGVYLYKISGRAVDFNRDDKQSVVEKFVILH
jgi:hypothetical protein